MLRVTRSTLYTLYSGVDSVAIGLHYTHVTVRPVLVCHHEYTNSVNLISAIRRIHLPGV